jgi:hypothetical protein
VPRRTAIEGFPQWNHGCLLSDFRLYKGGSTEPNRVRHITLCSHYSSGDRFSLPSRKGLQAALSRSDPVPYGGSSKGARGKCTPWSRLAREWSPALSEDAFPIEESNPRGASASNPSFLVILRTRRKIGRPFPFWSAVVNFARRVSCWARVSVKRMRSRLRPENRAHSCGVGRRDR